jgi:hypothetical protein
MLAPANQSRMQQHNVSAKKSVKHDCVGVFMNVGLSREDNTAVL